MWEETQVNPCLIYSEVRRRAVLGEVDDPMLSRKASSECHGGPYPKPTQVVR